MGEHWTLTTLREKLIKIGAKVVRHGRHVTVQLAEVAIPRRPFAEIPRLIDGPRRHDVQCHRRGVEAASAGLSALAERASSDTGLHPGRVSDAPSTLSEESDLDCRLTLSISIQSCYRLRRLGGIIWEIPAKERPW